MGFFVKNNNPSADIVNKTEKMIVDFFNRMGLDEKTNRDKEQPGTWIFYKGSALIAIQIQEDPKGKSHFLSVNSPINLMPKNNKEALYEYLLDLNDTLPVGAFFLREDVIGFGYTRPLAGLDPEELTSDVICIAGTADHYDNVIETKFGARKLGEDMI